MESQNPSGNKRYNKFRQARRKKDKSYTINVDEVSGRHYKLERFLKDCILHLPKHAQEFENDLENAVEEHTTAPKTSKQKHVKLPVLNECKGLFENVIIGRSAKKVGEFGGIAATPEDRARLHEDIHALAKVGPDSELSFEMFPPSPLQNRPLTEIQGRYEIQERPVSPTPEPVTETSSLNAPGESWPEEQNRTRRSRSPKEDEPNLEAGSHEDMFPEHRSNSVANDAAGLLKEDNPAPRQSAFHCDCCRKTKPPRTIFDSEGIFSERPEPDRRSLQDPSHGVHSLGSTINVTFSNHKDPSWLFEDASGGPANSLGSTYQSRAELPFDFKGIEIQSSAPSFRMGVGDECRDVYTRSFRELPSGPGMLKRRIPWCGFNKLNKKISFLTPPLPVPSSDEKGGGKT